MRTRSISCALLFFFAIVSFYTLQAQIPTANSFSSQVPYTGIYRYGINLGFFPGWSAQNNATLAAGTSTVRGAGMRTYRIPLYDDFLTQWGLTVELAKFRTYASLGADDHTAFVGNPSPAHRDTTTYPGCTEQSRSFKNLFAPIWLDSAKTQVNPANYYAKYLYDVVMTYGQYVKFWEVMNEPDFTYSSAGWMDTWMTRDPAAQELENLRAPIYHYIRMLRVSWEVIKKFQPGDYVCVGGLGYRGFLDAVMRNTDNPVDGSITAAYPLKGGAYYDVLSYHNYPMYDIWMTQRNSDKAAAAFIAARDRMNSIAIAHGYNGTQYPAKQFICTETGASRFVQGNTWGSNEGQRNYAIKGSVLSQKNSIHQVYWFSLSDGPDPANQHDRMGLYNYLGATTPYNQTPTDQGKAFATMTDLIYGKRYDAAKTAALALPAEVEGAAFRAADGTYTYVLWAKSTLDIDETATAQYSFPAGVILSANVTRKEWDFAYRADSVTISKTGITLTGSPSFFTDGGNQAPTSNAGADQTITLPLNTVTLSGSGTDADGSIASTAWSQVSGPSTATIATPLQASTTVNNLVQGIFLFEFKVKDNRNAEARDTVKVTVNAAPVTVRIEAEAYTTMHGVQKEGTTDVGGGQNVGYIDAGDWMEYTINPATTGAYIMNFRVATQNPGAQFQVRKPDGTILATLAVPNTGGWQAWQTITTTVNLNAGSQAIRLYSIGGNWNINWFEFRLGGVVAPTPLALWIEAEDYKAQFGIQKESTADVGGGQNIGYVDAGDWLDYAVNITATGTYKVNLRVASPMGGKLEIRNEAGMVLATVTIPATGAWQSWQTVSVNMVLPAGQQTLRIHAATNGWNLNWWEIKAVESFMTRVSGDRDNLFAHLKVSFYQKIE
jgi:hypothetical protein